MDVRVIDHPLAAARLTALRDRGTDRAAFSCALRQLSLLLIAEATENLGLRPVEVVTPMAEAIGARLACAPLLVPVLRAGLGMLDAARELVPEAEVGFVGMVRDEAAEPTGRRSSAVSLPADLADRPVLLLDPMLATGGSMARATGLLIERGVRDLTVVCAVAAPRGVDMLRDAVRTVPWVRLVVAALDPELDADGYIVPGLGDAGDRLYGPR